jgi:hypothetical protein
LVRRQIKFDVEEEAIARLPKAGTHAFKVACVNTVHGTSMV